MCSAVCSIPWAGLSRKLGMSISVTLTWMAGAGRRTTAAWAPPRLAAWLGLEMSRRGRWRLGRLARRLEMSASTAWTVEPLRLGRLAAAWSPGEWRSRAAPPGGWSLEMERECVCGVA
jgi:hypothetical protein